MMNNFNHRHKAKISTCLLETPFNKSIRSTNRLRLRICMKLKLLCNGLVLAGACLNLQAQTALYNITDIGAPLGTNSVAQAINNPGSVVGYWSKSDGYATFLYQSNQVYELPALGTNVNIALSINDAGHVVGHSLTEDGYRAFYWDGSGPLNLGPWGGTNSYGTGINVSNLVIGFSEGTNGATAVLFDGQPLDIGSLGGGATYPLGINSANIIVGEAVTTNGQTHAFRYNGSGLVDLNAVVQSPEFILVSAKAVSGNSAIVGYGLTNGNQQAFFFDGTNMTVIPQLPSGTNAVAYAINSQNSVVGACVTTNGNRAFLWKSGAIQDLNNSILASADWVLREATGINDAGKVVGWGEVQGQVHAFMLTPNQPPSVSITSPSNGSTNSAPIDLALTASASDDVSISKVEFFAGSQLVGTKTSYPYSIIWPRVHVGTYTLKAVAYDDLGICTTSAPVVATVTLPRIVDIRSWLKADSLALANGASVSTWTDSSGKNNHATQSTSSKRPIFWTNQISGFPALRFDGMDDSLTYAPTLATNSFTMFAVARANKSHEIDAEGNVNGGGSGQRFLFSDALIMGTNVASAELSLGTNGLTAYEFQRRATGNDYIPSHATYAGPIGSQFSIVTLRYDSRRPDIFLNGFLVRAGYISERSTVYTPIQIGRDWTDGFSGDVAEVLIYSCALTTDEVGAVSQYLNDKYKGWAEPPVPTELTATALSGSEVLLTWKANLQTNIISFAVERKAAGGEFAQVGTAVQDTKFLNQGLTSGTTYTYRLKLGTAISTNGYSAEVTATTFNSTITFPLTNVVLWLRAQDATAGTNSKIATWPDALSSTVYARQTNGTLQPTLEMSPYQVRFAGGTYLELPSVATNVAQAEIITVLRSDTVSPATNQGLWRLGGGATYFPATNGVVWDSFASTSNRQAIAPLPVLTNDCIYSVASKSGLWQSRFNGETKQLDGTNTVKFSGMPVLGISSNGVFAGRIKEVIVFNRPLTTAEYAVVRDSLAQKYGIQLNPPTLPTNLTVTNNSQWQNTVSWTPLSGSQNGLETYFLLERKCVGNEGYVPAAIIGRTASSYIDTNVIPQLAYAYRLRAINDVGETISSDLISTLDSDGDGLSDFEETLLGTNPLSADSDGDGLPDGWEVKYGLNPLNSTGIDGATGDFDGEGLSNLSEYQAGTNPSEAESTKIHVYRPN